MRDTRHSIASEDRIHPPPPTAENQHKVRLKTDPCGAGLENISVIQPTKTIRDFLCDRLRINTVTFSGYTQAKKI